MSVEAATRSADDAAHPAPTRLEVCVESAAGALVAERSGADRVELCQALVVGGLTASIGTIVTTLQNTSRIGVQVLIRPRGGDFVFSATETRAMVADIELIRREARAAGRAVGFVIGALTEHMTVDRAITRELAAACDDAPVTMHRAFDLTDDLDASLDTLAELGIGRVLTAGGAQRATEGTHALARLVERGAGRITIMPGGSVRPHNAADILTATGAHDLHFRAVTRHRNHRPQGRSTVRLVSSQPPDEATREETSDEIVRAMRAAVTAPSTPEASSV